MSTDCRCGFSLCKVMGEQINVSWDKSILTTFNSRTEDISLASELIEDGIKTYYEGSDNAVFNIYEHSVESVTKLKEVYCEKTGVESDNFIEFINDVLKVPNETGKLYFVIF